MFHTFIYALGIITFAFLCLGGVLTAAAFIFSKYEDKQRKGNLEKMKADPEYWADYYGE